MKTTLPPFSRGLSILVGRVRYESGQVLPRTVAASSSCRDGGRLCDECHTPLSVGAEAEVKLVKES